MTQDQQNFLNKIAPIMQREAKNRGYKVVSTAIAQAIIEGNWGKSTLASKYHNHFGMKCGSKWTGASANLKTKEEYTVGTLTNISANFRVYSDDEQGCIGYYNFISSSRYANLKTATTYRQYAEMLKADGYATSSSYINTLCTTVEKYGLQKYDMVDTSVSYPTLRKGSKGEPVKMLQKILNEHGYNLTVDGIYGNNTFNAVVSIQGEFGLVKDGICGKKTWSMLVK